MFDSPEILLKRAALYAARNNFTLKEHSLGSGKDGTVFVTDKATAIKIHRAQTPFDRELACYRRLREHNVLEMHGHKIPKLVAWDNDLFVIEMTIVTRPFLLDFGDAYLDEAPAFPDEVIEQWHADGAARFGPQRWEKVQLLIEELHGRCGIILHDANPGNIAFGEGEV